jgi:hypothetical protein
VKSQAGVKRAKPCDTGSKDMEKRSVPAWRLRVLGRLDVVLILFELVLSVIFLSLSYVSGNLYLRGIGVGLIIAWVTSAIALLYRKQVGVSS